MAAGGNPIFKGRITGRRIGRGESAADEAQSMGSLPNYFL
jgi:hypothetical protein